MDYTNNIKFQRSQWKQLNNFSETTRKWPFLKEAFRTLIFRVYLTILSITELIYSFYRENLSNS